MNFNQVVEFIANTNQEFTNEELCKVLVDELNKLEEGQRHDLFFWNTTIEQTPMVHYEPTFTIYGIKTKFGMIYFYPKNNYIYKTNIDINIKGDSQELNRKI